MSSTFSQVPLYYWHTTDVDGIDYRIMAAVEDFLDTDTVGVPDDHSVHCGYCHQRIRNRLNDGFHPTDDELTAAMLENGAWVDEPHS